MDRNEIKQLNELTFDLNTDLCILKSAIWAFDEDLIVSNLIKFSTRLYETSNKI